ncbi:MAG: hypothetical protein WCG28_01910, partial [bacterium]
EDGVKNAWGWTKKMGNVGIGIAIFLVLLLLGSILEELLAPNRPEKLSLAWNAIIILFSSGLAVASVTGNRWWIGIILTIAFLVLTVQLGFPTYAKTWPDEKTISTNLDQHGFLGTGWKAVRRLANGRPVPTPPPPTNTVAGSTPLSTTPATRQVVQLPDQATPCTIDIAEIRDIYTDGEAVYVLPPGWSPDKAISYSGKGHLVIQGGDIHSGKWKFWSADSNKIVLIRVFVMK